MTVEAVQGAREKSVRSNIPSNSSCSVTFPRFTFMGPAEAGHYVGYSYRSASIGSSREARSAGRNELIIPTKIKMPVQIATSSTVRSR